MTDEKKEIKADRKNQTSLFTKIITPVAGLGFAAAFLSPMLRDAPEPLTLVEVLQQSYQQCQTIEDKDWRTELPLGKYTCQEVEDLYLKVNRECSVA